MANPLFSNVSPGFKPTAKPPADRKPAGKPAMKMKPGFSTGAPGKKQPKDRSAGITRAKVYPDSEGL